MDFRRRSFPSPLPIPTDQEDPNRGSSEDTRGVFHSSKSDTHVDEPRRTSGTKIVCVGKERDRQKIKIYSLPSRKLWSSPFSPSPGSLLSESLTMCIVTRIKYLSSAVSHKRLRKIKYNKGVDKSKEPAFGLSIIRASFSRKIDSPSFTLDLRPQNFTESVFRLCGRVVEVGSLTATPTTRTLFGPRMTPEN